MRFGAAVFVTLVGIVAACAGSQSNAPATAPAAKTAATTHEQIAYGCGAIPDICVIAPDGTGLTHLMQDDVNDEDPSWSPDGRRLAFASARESTTPTNQIFVMNSDGSGIRKLTTSTETSLEPRWSPDGNKLAFVREEHGNLEIFIMSSDGSEQVNLTKDPADDFDPAWSPDGTEIAFASTRGGAPEIYFMNPDGTNVTKFGPGLTPAWSPDGSKIALVHLGGIYVVTLADGSAEQLTKGYDQEPSWSPDGRWMAFRRGKLAGNADIYVVGADGSGLRRLTSAKTPDVWPAWSPAR